MIVTLELSWDFRGVKGTEGQIGSSYSSFFSDRLTIVRVANYSDRPIRLRSDFPVAEYSQLVMWMAVLFP